MKITEPGKTLEFDVLEYRHPTRKSPTKPSRGYDEAWLSVQIRCLDGSTDDTRICSCILAGELREFCDAFEAVIDGQAGSYISDFMEPFLKIAVARIEDKITFILHFVYDTTGGIWKTWNAAAMWSIEEAREALQDIQQFKVRSSR